MILEFFSCAGGMAEGFRRAGLRFDFAFDKNPDAIASYEANIGHRPVEMDVRDLLRLVRAGWRPAAPIRLIVADPPCTPWSRAGKRKGTEDKRDMLRETCELIALLRPQAYLIGNVPGLVDAVNDRIVQKVIGGLGKYGYCTADFARLDAADYGVPQHRKRPFWFGHLEGPCVRWPNPTHCNPDDLTTAPLPGVEPLLPWMTCRQALQHLPLEELGRPVRVRNKPSMHPCSKMDAPANGIPAQSMPGNGGRVLLANVKHPANTPDAPSFAVTTKGDGRGAQGACVLVIPDGHPPSALDAPARTLTRSGGVGTSAVLAVIDREEPVTSYADEPAKTITREGRNGSRATLMRVPQCERAYSPDAPAPVVTSQTDRIKSGAVTLEWPWNRPTTICAGIDKIAPANEHAGQFGPNAIVLSERAAAILQDFPESWKFLSKTKTGRWSMIGQAMPPGLAQAVAVAVRAQLEATGYVVEASAAAAFANVSP